MSSLFTAFFVLQLLVLNLGQAVTLVWFVVFRKKTLFASVLFIIILFVSLLLLKNKQIQIQFQQALQLQQQEVLLSQIQAEIVFWEQLSQQIDSVHIWLRLHKLYHLTSQYELAEQALLNAQSLDPLLD